MHTQPTGDSFHEALAPITVPNSPKKKPLMQPRTNVPSTQELRLIPLPEPEPEPEHIPEDNPVFRLPPEPTIAEKVAPKPTLTDPVTCYAVRTKAGTLSDLTEKTNQDSYVCLQDFGSLSHAWFFGVFDGHGSNGHLVSGFIKQELAG
jgi:hypothetical protein